MNILNKGVVSKDSVRKNKHSERETDNQEIGESFANAWPLCTALWDDMSIL